MKRLAGSVATLILFCLPVLSTRAQVPVTEVIEALQKAINQRDTSLITPYLAPHFSINTWNWPTSGKILPGVIAHLNKDFTFQTTKAKPMKAATGKTSVKLELKSKNDNKIKKGTMVLNRDGKIEYISFFDELYGMHRDKKSKLVATVPFEFEDGEIMVKLRLNDSPLEMKFLFDTGADGMAITNTMADSVGVKVTRKQSTSVVGGNTDVQISTGNTFHLGAVSVPNKNMAIFPSEHLGVDGILGLSVASDYIIEVDFDASVLRLYTLGKFQYQKNSHTIPVTVPSGVAILDGSLNITGEKEYKGRFIFDTGAKFSLVCFENFVRPNRLLLSGFKYDTVGNMTSFNHNTMIYTGKAHSFSLGQNQLEQKAMPVTLQASNGKNDWTPGADGSLGIGFSQKYNFIINLVDKEINFRERQLH